MKNLSQLAFAACVSAHVVITYPGWRGNNLDADEDFPYGKQFTYPCRLPYLEAINELQSADVFGGRRRHGSFKKQDLLAD